MAVDAAVDWVKNARLISRSNRLRALSISLVLERSCSSTTRTVVVDAMVCQVNIPMTLMMLMATKTSNRVNPERKCFGIMCLLAFLDFDHACGIDGMVNQLDLVLLVLIASPPNDDSYFADVVLNVLAHHGGIQAQVTHVRNADGVLLVSSLGGCASLEHIARHVFHAPFGEIEINCADGVRP